MTHFYRGENDLAETELKKSLQVVEELHGPEHPLVSDVALDLGVVSFVNHDDAVAQKLMERSLAIRQKHHGKDSREALAALLFLTVLENTGGRSNPFRVQELAEVWDASEDNDGFGEFINLFLQGNLTARVDRRAALAEFAKADELGIRLLGEEHLIVSFFRSRHAELLSNLGRKDEARTMLEDAITSISKSLGENFILNGRLANLLGTVGATSSDLPGAEAAFRRSAEIYGKHLEVNEDELYQRQYQQSLQRLSVVLTRQGKYQAAAEALDPLVDLHAKDLGNHPEITQRYALLSLHPEKPELKSSDLLERRILSGKTPAFVGAIRYAKAMKLMRQNHDRPLVAQAMQARALKYLDHAVSKGFGNLENIRTNVAFDPLRSHSEFQKIIGRIEAP